MEIVWDDTMIEIHLSGSSDEDPQVITILGWMDPPTPEGDSVWLANAWCPDPETTPERQGKNTPVAMHADPSAVAEAVGSYVAAEIRRRLERMDSRIAAVTNAGEDR